MKHFIESVSLAAFFLLYAADLPALELRLSWKFWHQGQLCVFSTKITWSNRRQTISYYFLDDSELTGSRFRAVPHERPSSLSCVRTERVLERWFQVINNVVSQNLLAQMRHRLKLYKRHPLLYGACSGFMAYSDSEPQLQCDDTTVRGRQASVMPAPYASSLTVFPASVFFPSAGADQNLQAGVIGYVSGNVVFTNLVNAEADHAFAVILQQTHDGFNLVVTDAVVTPDNLEGVLSWATEDQSMANPAYSQTLTIFTFIPTEHMSAVTGWQELAPAQGATFLQRAVYAILGFLACDCCVGQPQSD